MRLRARRRRAGAGRRIVDVLLAAAILGLLALLSAGLDRVATESHAGVPRVGDGDSLSLGAERMRLHGIDAPEFEQKCRKDGADYACGRLARDALDRLIDGRPVVCTGRQRDVYLRLLVSCRIGEVDINRRMVAMGWAVAHGDYAAEEEAARQSGAGLWAGSFERPRDWRKVHGGLVEGEHAGLAEIVNWLRQVLRFL
jgi:endonuclease YncB( thermonuclease family)